MRCIYKYVDKDNEIYIQRCKQRRWDIYKDEKRQWVIYKDVNKEGMKYIQRCKQRQWDIYKDVNKGNEIYTKM